MTGMNPVSMEPPWLMAMVDQHLSMFEEKVGAQVTTYLGFNLVMMMLGEPDENATEIERFKAERTCDNCGNYTAAGFPFYTGNVMREHRGQRVCLVFGVCFIHRQDFKDGELTELT
jgi:hypothetical protein